MTAPVPPTHLPRLAGRAASGLALALVLWPAAALAQDAKAAIAAVNAEFSAKVAKSDAAGIAAMYTPDAEMLPPNGDVVRGTAAIRKEWEALIALGAPGLVLTSREVEAHGDTAHEVGAWELKGKDGAVVDRGKYIVIWKKHEGRWKLHRDIWNTSMPAPKM
jgi:uncharacterized protein (TIGR02246 family)